MIPAVLRMALASMVEVHIPVDSSAIDYIAASVDGVAVVLRTGHRYDIGLEDAIGLLTAASPGQYFNRFIKGRV